ncbi:MAG: choice-of-anchor L domain-containing protein [Sandaracinus sp.]
MRQVAPIPTRRRARGSSICAPRRTSIAWASIAWASIAWASIVVAGSGCYRTHMRREFVDGGLSMPDATTSDSGLTGPVTVACGEAVPPPSADGIVPCAVSGSGDHDGDGFANEDDCNDCVPQINGGAFDIPDNGLDEDCDGIDAVACRDTVISPDDGSARSAANALGLCLSTGAQPAREWLRGALWQDTSFAPHTIAEMHRVADGFGTYGPYAGRRMLVLSTGVANDELPPDESCVAEGLSSAFPPGFPMDSPACPGVASGPVVDSVALSLELDVPTNAIGLRFASNFMTREYPDFLCSPFNDVYAVLMTDVATGTLRNIVFDREGNPLTVNNALLRTCVARGPRVCELGARPLRGSIDASCTEGTEGLVGGGTDCVQTTAPVVPGSHITLSFMIWDSGDGVLDSVALVDAFEWVLAPFEQRAP